MGNKTTLNHKIKGEKVKGDLITFLKIINPTKITFKIIAIKKPNITIEPSIYGKGIMALPFFIPSSTTLSIAAKIKQTLQINTILEKIRMKKVQSLRFKVF